ncbi:MFS transporter [Rugosimonospora acidiphila]|uniref:MFS transporter n=1 Tax=Rugosimonospora acidiphila TaxID=556531 RepID=A0ABP9SKA6_9ACTN
MAFTPYREVLRLPGVRNLFLLGLFARIPPTTVGITLTLRVVNALHHSYGAAGLVTAAFTVGAALGSPLAGRFIDRRGARPVVATTTLVQAGCWAIAPLLGYSGLLAVAVLAGLFSVPVQGLLRQSLSAMVPEKHRRPAFALDSMAVELSFMIGPAVAVALATTAGTGPAIAVIGAGVTVCGVLLIVMNPPVRADHEAGAGDAVPRRAWVGPPLIAILIAGCAATFILSGADLSIVATLRQAGATSLTGLVFALWCLYSLAGGLVYGTLRRTVPVLVLVVGMGVLTVPVGFVPSWQLLCLTLIPCGVLCAPSLASANDALSRLVPAQSRGEAMGLFSAAMTAGTSLGAPFAGFVVDQAGARGSFAAAGAVGAAAALAAYAAAQRRSRALATAEPALEAGLSRRG